MGLTVEVSSSLDYGIDIWGIVGKRAFTLDYLCLHMLQCIGGNGEARNAVGVYLTDDVYRIRQFSTTSIIIRIVIRALDWIVISLINSMYFFMEH